MGLQNVCHEQGDVPYVVLVILNIYYIHMILILDNE